MSEPREAYITDTLTTPPNGSMALRRRAELWRQLCAHLIGLATVFWWIAFKESPPK